MDTVIIVQTDDDTALDMRTIDEGVNKAAEMARASIFMVPERLRKLNETAYTPRLFSIGPLHSHNDPHLQGPEIRNIKLSYLNALLARFSDDPQHKDRILGQCLHEMENLKEEAKKSYADAEKANALSKEMLVIDGCFILEFLYKHYNVDQQEKQEEEEEKEQQQQRQQQKNPKNEKRIMSDEEIRKDPIFGSVVMLNGIQHDLILLENQLPWFVLEKLFELTLNNIRNPPLEDHSLREYVLQCFGKVLTFGIQSSSQGGSGTGDTTSGGGDKKKDQEAATSEKYHHILHLLHSYYFLPEKTEESVDALDKNSRDSASDLGVAGVKFKAVDGDQFNFVFSHKNDVIHWLFSSPRFRIPRLSIYDSTEQILRNLIAFEQCCHGVVRYMTSYAFLMDLLVNTNEDIQVLEDAQVIHNYLGARPEATNLFNSLCKQVVLEKFYFGKTYNKANDYSQHWWPEIRAYFIRKYLATPYTFIAFVAGAIAFVIEVVRFVDTYFI